MTSNTITRNTFIFCIFLLMIFCEGCGKEEKKEGEEKISRKEITIKNKKLYVEIADNEEKRTTGLMWRKKLDLNAGMLFVYPREQKLCFWMKNTSIPLSIAYIDKNLIITEIHDMYPFVEEPICSKTEVKYGLEVNQGWFKNNNINIGDKVDINSN